MMTLRVEIRFGLVYVKEAGTKVSPKSYENVSAQAGMVAAAKITAAAKKRVDKLKMNLQVFSGWVTRANYAVTRAIAPPI
jgi:hypothetical protein